MASTYSLRAEMRAIILRGLKHLRNIEIAREVAESVMLNARMVITSALADDDVDEWAPEPDEIEAACSVIQQSWDDIERERRWKFEQRDPDKVKAWNDRYYAEKREQILERLSDPKLRELKSEYNRQYRERCKAQLKERRHAQRDLENARQRERRKSRAKCCAAV
jgi:hypothetical protein